MAYTPSTKICCTNCKQYGHHIRHCIQPVSSYGLIAFRIADPTWNQQATLNAGLDCIPVDKLQFLMIQRRNTYGFVEIIRGKYKLNDISYLRSIISETTRKEQEDLLMLDFDALWRNMWGQENKNYKHDFEISKEKFQKISAGVEDPLTRERYTLAQLICENKTDWKTAEWGFPKGKPNLNESSLETAEREFCEETGLPREKFHIFENLFPFQEMFYGTNQIQYKLIYYLAYIPYNVTVKMKKDDEIMLREIGDISWVSYEDALRKIRFYNNEKKDLLIQIYNVLKNYCPLLIGPINQCTMPVLKPSLVLDEQHNRGCYEPTDDKKNQACNYFNGRTYAEVATATDSI